MHPYNTHFYVISIDKTYRELVFFCRMVYRVMVSNFLPMRHQSVLLSAVLGKFALPMDWTAHMKLFKVTFTKVTYAPYKQISLAFGVGRHTKLTVKI